MAHNNKQYHIYIDKNLMESVQKSAKENGRKTSAEVMILLESGIHSKYGYDALQDIKNKQAKEGE